MGGGKEDEGGACRGREKYDQEKIRNGNVRKSQEELGGWKKIKNDKAR